MSIDDSQKFSSFASLNKYFTLIEFSKPTVEQAQEAVEALYRFYGAENEAELLSKADDELKSIYLDLKSQILNTAKSNEGEEATI